MAFYPKQSGTTVQSFAIGAGTGKNQFTIDASSLTTNTTWIIPNGNGTAGYVLSTDGTGNLSWIAVGSAQDQTTPYYIPTGETFTNNVNRQNLFSTAIEVDGTLEVDGLLIQV